MTLLERLLFAPLGRAVVRGALAAAASLALGCASGGRLEQVSTSSPNDAAFEQAQACVELTPEVRYRSGYDHIVYLKNRCDVSTVCSVATNVNPAAVSVVVPPQKQVQVLTFRGSPAREFTPLVSCRFGS